MRTYHRLNVLVGVAVLALSGGCSWVNTQTLHTVKYEDEAVTTHLSITSVEPWEGVAPLLNPDFSMTGTEALSKVIPTTVDMTSVLKASLSAQLQLAAQAVPVAAASNPSAVSSSTPVSQVASSTASRTSSSSGDSASMDPILQHLTADSLFQEVTLINREVGNAARRFGYRPYLVRFKLNMVPYTHNEPYDGYCDISFFTLSSGNDADHYFRDLKKDPAVLQPVVVPLLVTDNLVGTHSASTSDNARQLGASLGAFVHAMKATASLQQIADELRTMTGTSMNSLETVARHTDNTIRVRLGGSLCPDSAKQQVYVMEARSHNITILLLVPQKWDAVHSPRTVHVVSQTSLRNSKTGVMVSGRTERREERQLLDLFDSDLGKDWTKALHSKPVSPTELAQRVVKDFDATASQNCPSMQESGKEVDADSKEKDLKLSLIYYLYDRVNNNDGECFVKALNSFSLPVRNFEYMWNDLAAFGSTYGESEAMLELPPRSPVEAPPTQMAVLRDDGASATTTHLIGGRNLAPDRLRAALIVKSGLAPVMASSISAPTPTDLQITFPTMVDNCGSAVYLSTANFKQTPSDKDLCGQITIWQEPDPWLESAPRSGSTEPTDDGSLAKNTYRSVYQTPTAGATSQTPAPANPKKI